MPAMPAVPGSAELGVAELTDRLRRLGLSPRTGTLLVHAALRTLGPVQGGSAGVLDALRAALGPDGTLLAFTATPENSDTSRLDAAATAGLDRADLQAYRRSMPPFDPATTPASPTMGRLSEELRNTPGALRSTHPQTSFAALGPKAAALTADHRLDCHLGEESPLGRLYRERGWVLMLGASPERCTALQLAEYRVPDGPVKRYGCMVRGPGGHPRWERFDGLDLDDQYFRQMLPEILPGLFRLPGPVAARTARIRGADCLLLPVVQAVDAALGWHQRRPAGALR
ncbi:aminoglycoside N(3)-acetyltransferase [Kitasatospora sp. LaBMicrA B282]|uniref:aminoglycoside N(3)-acetyltransferase n=1 Tax=Kitasatospora sp. LaBMicrA B282 TaxID=3420949 RepID=UPI003D0D99F2